ncbi:hypothetical protein LSAT2_005322, partial [Lamellibrachia satsuma]
RSDRPLNRKATIIAIEPSIMQFAILTVLAVVAMCACAAAQSSCPTGPRGIEDCSGLPDDRNPVLLAERLQGDRLQPLFSHACLTMTHRLRHPIVTPE